MHDFRSSPLLLSACCRGQVLPIDEQLSAYPLVLSFKQRLIPKIIQIIHDLEGHRLRLGIWMLGQVFCTSNASQLRGPECWYRDSGTWFLPAAYRNDSIWEAWWQAFYLCAHSNTSLGDLLVPGPASPVRSARLMSVLVISLASASPESRPVLKR